MKPLTGSVYTAVASAAARNVTTDCWCRFPGEYTHIKFQHTDKCVHTIHINERMRGARAYLNFNVLRDLIYIYAHVLFMYAPLKTRSPEICALGWQLKAGIKFLFLIFSTTKQLYWYLYTSTWRPYIVFLMIIGD